MKRFSEQLHKKAHGIRLSATERALLRERLVTYMEYHPLTKESPAPTKVLLTTESFTAVPLNYRYISSFIGICATLVLIVVPVIAERTVPGDVLYPVKVQFNEELRSTLSFSPYAKVEWETKRLERRLAEARLLADEGKLTEEIEAEVAEAVHAHSEAAKQEIEVIRANDNDEAAIAEIAFVSALEVQSEVLESREGQAGEPGRSVAALVGAVAEARSGVEASQESANPSFEKLIARLEMETTNAQELFASIQESASPEEIANIERRFEDVKRKIDESNSLHGVTTEMVIDENGATTTVNVSEADVESKRLLKVALTDTRKLVAFMTDIDVRTSVSIEKLVPVTLTKEEARQQVGVRLQAMLAEQERILAVVPHEESSEKFAAGLAKFERVMAQAEAAFAEGNVSSAATLLDEANRIGEDLLLLGEIGATASTTGATSTGSVDEPEQATSTATSTDTTPDDVEEDAEQI